MLGFSFGATRCLARGSLGSGSPDHVLSLSISKQKTLSCGKPQDPPEPVRPWIRAAHLTRLGLIGSFSSPNHSRPNSSPSLVSWAPRLPIKGEAEEGVALHSTWNAAGPIVGQRCAFARPPAGPRRCSEVRGPHWPRGPLGAPGTFWRTHRHGFDGLPGHHRGFLRLDLVSLRRA